MFFKRKDEPKNPKYKATYKSLHSGSIKKFAIVNATEALTSFLQKGDNIWEMYMLVSITPIDETI